MMEAASVAVVETVANPTASAERERMNQIAERCGIDLRFVKPEPPQYRSPIVSGRG